MSVIDNLLREIHLGSDATKLADQLGFAERPFQAAIGFEDTAEHFYGRMERGDRHHPLTAGTEDVTSGAIAESTGKMEGEEGELPAGSLIASVRRVPIATDVAPEDSIDYWHRQDQLAAMLLEIAEHQKQRRKERKETATFEVDLGIPGANGGMLIAQGVKLPRGSAIAYCYLENNGAAAKVNLYAGGQGSGRLLCTVNFGHWACLPIPDDIKTLSIVSTATDTGLVRIDLTTETWAPARGTI